ncbi:hypothetical protein RG963_09365 [Methanosarcina sp. Z-7115]|uniref:Uncharacterized protein n=1 Tax=Methanosarcina baikalica TaxID=3073890 RepID=A0ABU2D1V9_9EURY|nr:hypothetical protein [Methanosarcina sp. Z-7115]MDR7665976.1 hypothetical protein [Methanosarcina sp. Z-7115]
MISYDRKEWIGVGSWIGSGVNVQVGSWVESRVGFRFRIWIPVGSAVYSRLDSGLIRKNPCIIGWVWVGSQAGSL